MKIVTKNGFSFAVGMFWQIPDYARKSINLTKVLKDTGNDMYCQLNNFNATVGFCHKSLLQGHKNVASLGKFIIEAAKLTAAYSASIICYKFKQHGELDDSGNQLKEDLFGYLVLLNGTICPIDGEYVGEFELVRNSIIEQAKLYSLDTLYLPIDVADRFLNIFERLEYAYHTEEPDELLRAIMQNVAPAQLENLLFVLKEDKNTGTFNELINYLEKRISNIDILMLELNLNLLKKLINSEGFRSKIRDNVQTENNIRYLVASILQIPLSSNEIFWNNKLKHIHSKCLLYPIISKKKQLYKILIALGIFASILYAVYWQFFALSPILHKKPPMAATHSTPELLPASQLIDLCLGNGNDKLFNEHANWSLNQMKCNSLGAEYQFKAKPGATKSDLTVMLGTTTGVNISAGNGKYKQKFSLRARSQISPFTRNPLAINMLEQGANSYEYKLTTFSEKSLKHKAATTQFTIIANVSPVFLLKHNVLTGVKLQEIEMKTSNTSGIYTWTIQGEF